MYFFFFSSSPPLSILSGDKLNRRISGEAFNNKNPACLRLMGLRRSYSAAVLV